MRYRIGLIIILAYSTSSLAQEVADPGAQVEKILQQAKPQMSQSEVQEMVSALAALGPAAVPAISRYVADGGVESGRARDALKCIGAPAVEVLIDQLKQGATPDLRRDAIRTLEALAWAKAGGVDKAVTPLLEVLDDPAIDQGMVDLALQAIAPQSEEVCLTLVRRICEKGEDHSRVLQAIKTVPDEAIRMLIGMLEDPHNDSGARREDSLRSLGPRLAPYVPELVGKLNGEMSSAQYALPGIIIAALGEQAGPVLAGCLTTAREQSIRNSIIRQAFRERSDGKLSAAALQALVDALSHDTIFPAYALRSIGAPAADLLIAATTSPDPITRHNAIFALGRAGLPPSVPEALEVALNSEDMREACMAAIALADTGGTPNSAAAIEKVRQRFLDAEDAQRIFADALFRLGVVKLADREADLPLYTLFKEQVESEEKDFQLFSYSIGFSDSDQPIFLSNLKSFDEGWGEGFDADSMRLEWVDPGRLLQITWDTIVQGNGKYMITGIVLAGNMGGRWKELYRHSGPGASGGLGSGGSDYNDWRFLYNPSLNTLRLEHLHTAWSASLEPQPLFVNDGSTHWSGKYNSYYDETDQWPAEIQNDTVVTKQGASMMTIDGYEFPVSEWAAYTKVPEAELRRMNPHLRDRANWFGPVYVNVAVPPHLPDHGIYYSDGR